MVVFSSFDLSLQDDIDLLHLRIPLPSKERDRVKVLRQVRVLDTNTHDPDYDRFTALCSRAFKVPFAVISFVDVKRVWLKSRVGIADVEIPRDISFCAYSILDNAPPVILVPDATKEMRFCHNPFVVAPSGIRFIAAVPILCQDMKLGTLMIMDTKVRYDFDEKKQSILQDLAELISIMLESRRGKVLEQEEELAKLIIGVNHHLKGPLRKLSKDCCRLNDDFRSIKSICLSNAEHPLLKSIVPELMRSIDQFYLQVEQFHEQVEIALIAATAYDHAKRNLQAFAPLYTIKAKQQAFAQAIPQCKYVQGRDLVDALQQSGCLSQHLLGHVEWEICKVLQHGEIRADVGRLGIVLSSTMTLGAQGCERMKMTCSIEGEGDYDFENFYAENDGQERLGRLMVNVTMSRPKGGVKPSNANGGPLIGGNTFVFAGMTAYSNAPTSRAQRVENEPSMGGDGDIDSEVIQQCNEVICSTILRAEHGGYRQQRTAVMDRELLLISCWLPCKYRVSKEFEDACPQDWTVKKDQRVPTATEFSGMAVIEEGEDENEEEEEPPRSQQLVPRCSCLTMDDAADILVDKSSGSLKSSSKKRRGKTSSSKEASGHRGGGGADDEEITQPSTMRRSRQGEKLISQSLDDCVHNETCLKPLSQSLDDFEHKKVQLKPYFMLPSFFASMRGVMRLRSLRLRPAQRVVPVSHGL